MFQVICKLSTKKDSLVGLLNERTPYCHNSALQELCFLMNKSGFSLDLTETGMITADSDLAFKGTSQRVVINLSRYRTVHTH